MPGFSFFFWTPQQRSLITLSVKHGRTLDDARQRLEMTVNQVQSQFATMVDRTEWSSDRNTVRLVGKGFWVEMRVDPTDVHINGDIPILGKLLGGPLTAGLKKIVEKNFQKKLT